jgi:hypothetical protein
LKTAAYSDLSENLKISVMYHSQIAMNFTSHSHGVCLKSRTWVMMGGGHFQGHSMCGIDMQDRDGKHGKGGALMGEWKSIYACTIILYLTSITF